MKKESAKIIGTIKGVDKNGKDYMRIFVTREHFPADGVVKLGVMSSDFWVPKECIERLKGDLVGKEITIYTYYDAKDRREVLLEVTVP